MSPDDETIESPLRSHLAIDHGVAETSRHTVHCIISSSIGSQYNWDHGQDECIVRTGDSCSNSNALIEK
jgi:hypothetical protein